MKNLDKQISIFENRVSKNDISKQKELRKSFEMSRVNLALDGHNISKDEKKLIQLFVEGKINEKEYVNTINKKYTQ